MKIQQQRRECKTQVLEGCASIAQMPEKDLQQHVNQQIKAAVGQGKKEQGAHKADKHPLQKNKVM